MSKQAKNPSIAKLVDTAAVNAEQGQGPQSKADPNNKFAAPSSASSASTFSSNGIQAQQAAQQANFQNNGGQYFPMQQQQHPQQQIPQQYGTSFLPPPNPMNVQQPYYIPFFPNPYYNPSQQQQHISQQRFSSGIQPTSMSPNGSIKLPTFSGSDAYYQKGQQGPQAPAGVETAAQGLIPQNSGYMEAGAEAGGALKQNIYEGISPSKRAQQSVDPDNESKPYKCAQCDWAFIRHSDLRRHARSHGSPEYHCPYWHPEYATCPHRNQGSFNRLDVLKRHLRLVHFDPEVKEEGRESLVRRQDTGTCLSCGKYFVNSKAFIDHVDDCALNTPMEQWRFKKNGIVTSVKKDGNRGFDEGLEPNSEHPYQNNIEQRVLTGDDILEKSSGLKYRESESEPVEADAVNNKRLASSLDGSKNASHNYLKRPRGRPRKLMS
ncbi:hypothetical protein OGAPHI_000449 [Ogataea philodendri]|uniref:C2H2-type domain-containing protein n=1 Tax=Ogataea philodendri TaxID=1378263 RepID=A0A9P8PI96_9ASCO|nr:uncharacterized protein OGAPHI_000449 [Ogataea philodendri]KAH3671744.1 hypothetical protein OGAPHI_000449 [Ogataea philodendri]